VKKNRYAETMLFMVGVGTPPRSLHCSPSPRGIRNNPLFRKMRHSRLLRRRPRHSAKAYEHAAVGSWGAVLAP
jgi:hypothetical protein